MTAYDLLSLTREALTIVLWVALPVVLIASLGSLAVAIAQAVTQVQDQSLGQTVRLVTVMVTLLVSAGWQGRSVLEFAERALQVLGLPG